MNKKILFVTRKYPPKKGGMQKYSYDFYTSMKLQSEIDLLKGNLFFISFKYFLIIFFNKNKYKYIHFGDGVLSFLVLITKFLNSKVQTSITVHGLDITYSNKIYQIIIKASLKKIDKIICVSKYTYLECLNKNISKNKCIIINNGIKINKIQNIENIKKKNKDFIIISVGRQIKRKGINWFIKNVLLKLDKKIKYIIVGEGPELKKTKEIIKYYNLQKQVTIVGEISNYKLNNLFKIADLFIMPNIKLKNDIEGFGIVLLEASINGVIPIASNIDGIPDAIINNKNGHLCNEQNTIQFINLINYYFHNKKELKKNRKKFRDYTIKNYDWRFLVDKYLTQVFYDGN